MRIRIATARGEGRTQRAALASALRAAGLASLPVVRRAALIPEHSFVHRGSTAAGTPGQRRRCVVVAYRIEDRPGRPVWAGLGWAVTESTGRGRFARRQGSVKRRVVFDLHVSLERWSQRQTEACSPIQTEIVGGVCNGRPICVLVAAVCEQPKQAGARRAAHHSLIAEVS